MFQKRKIYIGCSDDDDERPCDLMVTSVRDGYLYGYLTIWAYGGDKDTLVERVKACIKSREEGGEYVYIPLKDNDWIIDSDSSI